MINEKLKEIVDDITELENVKSVKIFDCGLYAEYEAQIKGKYSKNGITEILPDNYVLILVDISNIWFIHFFKLWDILWVSFPN